MIIHNSEQFLSHLNLAYSLVDTVIAALDHPDSLANRRSLIDCLEMSGSHIDCLRDLVQHYQSNIISTTAIETV